MQMHEPPFESMVSDGWRWITWYFSHWLWWILWWFDHHDAWCLRCFNSFFINYFFDHHAPKFQVITVWFKNFILYCRFMRKILKILSKFNRLISWISLLSSSSRECQGFPIDFMDFSRVSHQLTYSTSFWAHSKKNIYANWSINEWDIHI